MSRNTMHEISKIRQELFYTSVGTERYYELLMKLKDFEHEFTNASGKWLDLGYDIEKLINKAEFMRTLDGSDDDLVKIIKSLKSLKTYVTISLHVINQELYPPVEMNI